MEASPKNKNNPHDQMSPPNRPRIPAMLTDKKKSLLIEKKRNPAELFLEKMLHLLSEQKELAHPFIERIDQYFPKDLLLTQLNSHPYHWFTIDDEQWMKKFEKEAKESLQSLESLESLEMKELDFSFHWLAKRYDRPIDLFYIKILMFSQAQTPTVEHLLDEVSRLTEIKKNKDKLQELLLMVIGNALTELESKEGISLWLDPFEEITKITSNTNLACFLMGEFFGPGSEHYLVSVEIYGQTKAKYH